MIFKKNNIEKILGDIQIPLADINFKKALAKHIIQLKETDDHIQINISFVLPKHHFTQLENDIRDLISKNHIKKIFSLSYQIHARQSQPNVKPLKNIKNIIAVTAGKGGVGKSTISINLAAALATMGARVGLLDADIYGPNQPQLCGIDLDKTQLETQDNQFVPIEKHGFKHISIGYLIDNSAPAIWRGPMATKALMQLCLQTQWGELDYLIVDMPPGTGDIPLTLAQKIPVAGSVVVATPQSLALSDIQKSMAMLEKVKIPILGIVENMGLYQCQHCGETQAVFSQNHSAKLCQSFNKPLLAQIPLNTCIDQASEAGVPAVLQEQSVLTEIFTNLAAKLSLQIASQPRDYSVQFPNIVVE